MTDMVRPYGLRTEQRHEPLGLEVPTSDPDGVLVAGRPSDTGATLRLVSGKHVVTAPFPRETP